MPRRHSRSLLALLVALTTLLLIGTSSALGAATFTLSVSPGPPQAVLNDGASALQYDYSITFDTMPLQYTVEIVNPSNVTVSSQTFPIGGGPGAISGSGSYLVPGGSAPGRWRVRISYYNDDPSLEATNEQDFLVAGAIGTITAVKYEDMNGNGIRDIGEPGVASWPIEIARAAGGGLPASSRTYATAANGVLAVPSLPVGDYTVTEGSQAGWVNTTPTSQALSLTSGQNALVEFGNARLGRICGTVYRDDNENGVRDPQETTRFGNVSVSLSGPRPGAAQTNASGDYCFNDLPPGSYRVVIAVPAGQRSVGDADGPANGTSTITPVNLTSGASILDRDFGLAPPPARLAITKKAGAKRVKAGQLVKWTVTVRNLGPSTARNVQINDPLAAYVTLGNRGGARLSRGSLVWRLGNMAPGATRKVVFTLRIDRTARGGVVRNVARADADNAAAVSAADSVTIVRVRQITRTVAVTG